MSSTLPWQMSFVIYNEYIISLLTMHKNNISLINYVVSIKNNNNIN